MSFLLRSIRLGASMTAFALVLGSEQNVLSQWNSTAQRKPLEDALRRDLQDYLNTRSRIEHISTLSMTVSFRGGSTIKMAVGTTKYGGGERVTPNNLFQIGSNTKAFTSVLLLRLEAADELVVTTLQLPAIEPLGEAKETNRIMRQQAPVGLTGGIRHR